MDPDDPPQAIPALGTVACRKSSCRHVFATLAKDRFGRLHLLIGGQPVYLPADNSIGMPCPVCGEWRRYSGRALAVAIAGPID